MSDTADVQTDRINQARLASLGTMVAGITHELNTPLGAIHSNHDVIERALLKLQDILEDEVVTPDELEEVRKIVRAMDGVLRTNGIAVERLVKLVESLRTFGRPDRAEIDRVDLHEGLDSTLAVLGHELKMISVEKDYGELPMVECYPNRINQVFMNLLHNATQAMPDGGTLGVSTSTNGGRVRIEVRDTGCGIERANLERIFEPGFTTKDGRVGMGLGLAISHQIVDQHGGTIAVDSELEEGTTFRVALPIELSPEHRALEGGDDDLK
ncbi:MAG: ATP-binding protein [Gemmatimonadetes bacterium]|nr:ATP-binding protein [Gemmatimonadota bacterium]